MAEPVLLIHGGAGPISCRESDPKARQQYVSALRRILQDAGALLQAGESAVAAVAYAVALLEDCPLFNAGHGAVFTRDGTHELDASIMDGTGLDCGAVANVTTIRNPIRAARAVMEHGPHVMLVGSGAERFAHEHGLEQVQADYFSTELRRQQLEERRRELGLSTAIPTTPLESDSRPDLTHTGPLDDDNKLGTVGAVALDRDGRLAAATSTGGMTNKHPGRVGDSPIIGAGCYANNATCAVSATGTGEAFIRVVAAYDVSAQMQYGGRTLHDATRDVVFCKLPAVGGEGGLIAVDRHGRISLVFNTEGMYRGYVRMGRDPCVAVDADVIT